MDHERCSEQCSNDPSDRRCNVKPLRLDWFERVVLYQREVLHPFREAWLTDEYDEVMDILDLDIIEWWLR